ncbi:MauE/DoxX family redox-associated membrane protein [uncultured Paracoccus sp.]|uniref:MauE/DoxX family redox-associated membrane protein n=1 Tax=uncultured Paracoccus sp. TaxID=189685 RepID=UPI0025EDA61B|nr:MauE/DoxX family redox-associated membrane protein [uncultured Paracoccus sp.]
MTWVRKMLDVLHEPLLTWGLRAFLALLFATAAISKLGGLEEFHGVVRNFRLLPEGLARPVAMVLPVVELAVAAGLLVTLLAVPAAIAAAGLLAAFGLAIAINVIRGRTWIDCGCFRNGMKQRISWLVVGRNALLTALALAVAGLLPQAGGGGALDALVGLMAGAVMMMLYFSISMLGGLAAAQASTLKGR